MTHIIITDEELELVAGAGETGEAVGQVIGAGIGTTPVCPVGASNGGLIGAAVGGKIEDIVTGACVLIASGIRAL